MLRGSLLAAVLLALAIGASASNAAFHGRNGRIAFVHDGRIYTMTAHGTERHQLTRRPKVGGVSPSYSPNGRTIAFISGRKQSDLWTMHSDGTHQRRLTYTAHLDEGQPAWSPDGKKIVFGMWRPTSGDEEIGIGIWIVRSDGRGRRRLTSGRDGSPSWSPDGRQIAFSRYAPEADTESIFVVAAGGGVPTDLSTEPGVSDYQPDWSPDGRRIVFASDPDTFRSNLWVMNADGSERRLVTNTDDVFVYAPVWSPDGRWIAYEGDDQHGDQIYVSRPDGSKLRVLPHACDGCSLNLTEPSWQPLP